MGTDWAAEQLGAYNDIKEDGTTVTIRSKTIGTYNPVTEATSGGGTTEYPTYCLVKDFIDASNDMVMSLALLHDKTSIKKGDRLLIVPAYGLPDLSNPAIKQEFDLVYGGNVHTILSVQSVEPGGTAILFKVQARR